ncbi:hypothetical protein AGMMS50268_03920 [Spirochaetia bacterium]|nr:hypothetical protein AGMMS50268_03920 [Spirochaetia bacterium]
MKTDGSDKETKGAKEDNDPAKGLKKQIQQMASQFESALPNKIGVERMMRVVMTAILNNPKLALCEPNSFFGALLQALQLGLEVNTPLGQAYLIPRKKNDKNGKFLYWECKFQLGYQGLLDLCYRWGKYRYIGAEIVYEGDDFSYEFGTSQYLRHIPKHKTEKPTFVWAKYEMDNGGQRFVVWTWDKVWKHAMEFSESYDAKNDSWKFSAWSSNQESKESMGQKTLLHTLLKFAPKSVEVAQAVSADERSIIARPVSEGGETKFHFDVETPAMIEAPDENAKDFMNKVNNGTGKKAGEKMAESAAQEAETVPAQSAATKSKGNPTSSLFPKDEDEALAEQYEQQQAGIEPPDFG